MKIVKESLNEVIFFEKGKDPLSTLGVGKRKLIENWLKEMDITDYKINNDLTINSDKDNENIYLVNKELIKFPTHIQFHEINSVFRCDYNKLISLKGCPKYVKYNFCCDNNQLTSLKYCPKYVGGSFYCYFNQVKFTKKYIRSLCDVKIEIYIKNMYS